MPTYQYRCRSCDELLEAVQKFTDPALTECPNCGGDLRKVYNAVGIVFKGSGFYATDSRTKGGKEAAIPAATGESKSTDAKPASTDAKPATSSTKPASSTGSSSTN